MRFLFLALLVSSLHAKVPVVRSVQSGPWSSGQTWEGGKTPAAGAAVLVRAGHTVSYDIVAEAAVRSVHIAGTLSFATDRDTRLDAGLIRVQQDEDTSEEGFECDAHIPTDGKTRGALLVGTADQPVAAQHTALIRLVMFDGMDEQSLPALVDCGGRMDFHGAEMNRTWVKLESTAAKGDSTVKLAEPVQGWKTGDKLVVVGTTRQSKHADKKTFREHAHDLTETEERLVKVRIRKRDHAGFAIGSHSHRGRSLSG
jgi:hypothetical protein